MVWMDLVLGAVVGGLVGGLVAVVFGRWIKRRYETERARGWAFAIVIGVAIAAAQFLLKPMVQRHLDAASLDSELQQTPAFVVLKTYDAASYDKFVESMREGVKAGATRAEMVANAQSKMRNIVLARLPASSDAAAIAYMKAMIAEVEHLYQSGGDKCHTYLFPTEGKALEAKDLTPELVQADLAALAEVLRTALVSPQPFPTDEAYEAAVSKSFARYLQANSAELAALPEPKATEQERRRVCKASTAMYQEIFKLPTPQAGTVIRYFLASLAAPQQ